MNDVKRPHHLPVSYQRPWADERDQVAVRRRGAPVHVANIRDVGVRRGIYGSGIISAARERMFAALECEWPLLREALIRDGGLVAPGVRKRVAMFMAFQYVRSDHSVTIIKFLHELSLRTAERPIPRGVVRNYLREQVLRQEPEEPEVEATWTVAVSQLEESQPDTEQRMRLAMQLAVHRLGPFFEACSWRVETCTKPLLFTGDQPVMSWTPPSVQDHYMGSGLNKATEVRLPLSPRALLVLERGGFDRGPVRVQPARFRHVNSGIASQCHSFAMATASQAEDLAAVRLADWRPYIRFWMAPGVRVERDGTKSDMGEVIQIWSPTHV